MNILDTIMAERREDVARAKREAPASRLRGLAANRTHHSLVARLRAGGATRIVAEMKKASPSAGLLSAAYRPEALAVAYADAGAAGLSVLTEPRHFQGSGADLAAARQVVDLPILRKDFICDEYQILEAAAWGADVILLIVAALEVRRLRPLYEAAEALGLDVLAEAHTADELERALGLPRAIIGINSRNLKTLKTDLAVAHALARKIPEGRLCIAESGIRSRADIAGLEASGYDGFLIGETLMRSGRPGAELRRLLSDVC